jgi:hypothetical protein
MNLQISITEPTYQLDATSVPPHQPIDIIVCIHNALAEVQRCLDLIVQYSTPPYTLIIVDDGILHAGTI